MISLTLPFPISVNRLYDNSKRGRVKTDRYQAWLTEAGWELKAQGQKPVTGLYAMQIVLNEADKRRRDIANFEKCVSDLLVKHGLIEDDYLCQDMHITRKRAAAASVNVTVKPMGEIQC